MGSNKGILMTFQPSQYLTQLLINQQFTLYNLHAHPIKSQQFQEICSSIHAVACNATQGVNADLVESLPNLEIIASYSVGVDQIDLNKCAENGVRVSNTPNVLTDDVADLCIGLVLTTLRNLCVGDKFVRCGAWEKCDLSLGTKFSGKSVGILGLGRIGSAIAKRAEAFGCPIGYCSRSKKPDVRHKYYDNVTELALNSQILIVSCSLTEETHHIIDREVIDALGPTGILINIGRGAHIVESELVSALVERRLGGAGLDVFENEPHVPEELFRLDNVVVMSHVGSDTVETCKAMAELVVGNLEAHFLKKPLLTPVICH